MADVINEIRSPRLREQLHATLNYNVNDQYGGAKIGGLYQDGVLIPSGIVQGTYVASTTQNYLLGARRITIDGRVFKYAKASNIITNCQFGVKFWSLSSDGIENNLSQAQLAGDKSILIPDAAVPVTKDQLRGGYVIIHLAAHPQFRGILGNTVVSAGKITIYLDGPLSANIATATYTEVFPNPYANVYCHSAVGGHPAGAFSSVAGIPAIITAAVNQYLWIQTWGPIFINPYGAVGNTPVVDIRTVVFDHEGAIAYESGVKGITATAYATKHQVAGFIINRQVTGVSGPPLVMLQISI